MASNVSSFIAFLNLNEVVASASRGGKAGLPSQSCPGPGPLLAPPHFSAYVREARGELLRKTADVPAAAACTSLGTGPAQFRAP